MEVLLRAPREHDVRVLHRHLEITADASHREEAGKARLFAPVTGDDSKTRGEKLPERPTRLIAVLMGPMHWATFPRPRPASARERRLNSTIGVDVSRPLPVPYDIPCEWSRGCRGAYDRPRPGSGARVACAPDRRRHRGARSGRDHRRARARPTSASDRHTTALRRSAASDLRSAVAAQGDPPRQRIQGPARRGGRL